MKFKSILLAAFLFLFIHESTLAQDYLLSTSAIGSGITTDNSKLWTDIDSVTIDVTDMSNLLITVGINMRPDGTNTNGREANYNIYRSDYITDNSGIIKRQLINNNEPLVESWGIGTLVHIFDVSGISGNKTFVLEHSNQGNSQTGRNVYSYAKMTAVALTTKTNKYELSNDVKRLGDPGSTTTSTTYTAVGGLTTGSITLPINGDIFVSASINGKASAAGSVAEYKLQYSIDGGTNWADLGETVKRSMINTYDDGIVSLVAMLQDQTADTDFQFRIQHRRESGGATITTHNCNLVAVALAHSGNDYFPSFYNELDATGVDITGVSTSPTTALSASLLTNFDISSTGPSLFIGAQYLVNASGLNESASPDPQRMRAGNNLFVDDGTLVNLEEYYRYIPDNTNYGSGGFFGLLTDLNENTEYTVGMKHEVAYVSNPDGTEDEVLNTSQVILAGFQTYDVTGGTTLPIDLIDFQANKISEETVLLNWQTASEKNNDYFSIERSDNAVDWIEIQQVSGAGNSSQLLNYEANDNSPLNSKAYYRLKQTDFDGGYSYSKIIAVNWSKNNISNLQIFPNPFNNEISINFNNNLESPTKIEIRNSIGVVILEEEISGDNSNHLINLDSSLPDGVYHVFISNNKETIVKSVIKQ